MGLITPFDPWRSKLCTCPPKLSFSPYVGCSHGCLYCYATSYIPNFSKVREKKKVVEKLKNEVKNLQPSMPISIANSSDPYPEIEKKLELTRSCLQILKNFPLLIVTKSDLVVRDIDLLSSMNVVVSITITTLDKKISSKIEPNAPLPEKRLKALKKLHIAKIPTTVRVDPIIPGLNDKEKGIRKLLKAVADRGVSHVISSTYKARKDNLTRMCSSFPELAEKWKRLYLREGEYMRGYYYLPSNLRFGYMKKIKTLTEKIGLSFGCCREGFNINSAICDGSHLLYKNES